MGDVLGGTSNHKEAGSHAVIAAVQLIVVGLSLQKCITCASTYRTPGLCKLVSMDETRAMCGHVVLQVPSIEGSC